MSLALVLAACGGGTSEPSATTETTAAEGDEAAPAAREDIEDEEIDPAVTRLITAGTRAPDFSLPDQTGALRTLAAEAGHPVVLYFYPRDATPGCTTEACAFRDSWNRYEEAGARVYGVSMDDVESHRAFAEEHELPFPLLADVDGSLARAYGVDTEGGHARRVTFLITEDGTVHQVFDLVDPAVHADEVLRAIADLVH